MSWDFSVTTKPIAKKDYPCQAAEWLDNLVADGDLNEAQLAIYEAAKLQGFKILKGTMYIKTTGRFNGEFSIFRARIDLDEICRDFGVYQDD